jgi:glucose-1-phosphate cytidylyltransferase
MKVVILCGGDGIRLKEDLNFIPKGMVFIDDKPIIWHIMKRFSLFGYNDFVLALGKNGNYIREYFLKYNLYTNDIEFNLGNKCTSRSMSTNLEENWNIVFANTGDDAATGARLSRCRQYVDDDFFVTYSDCLADVDIDKLYKQHIKYNKILTVTGIKPPFRYGEFIIKKNEVIDFLPISYLTAVNGFVNGGYMVFNNKIFNYLSSLSECTLESDIFKKLALDGQICVHQHIKFWQCLDNDREYEYLKKLCVSNKRYWLQP